MNLLFFRAAACHRYPERSLRAGDEALLHAFAVNLCPPDRGAGAAAPPIRPVNVLLVDFEERDLAVQSADEVRVHAAAVELRPSDPGAVIRRPVNVPTLNGKARTP